MSADSGPLVSMGEAQADRVDVGDVAGANVIKTTINALADLPPALATWAADQQEVSLRMIDALDKMRDRVDKAIGRLQGDMELYRVTDRSERNARQREIRIWLLALTAAMVAATLVIGALVWDRLALVAVEIAGGL